MKRDRYHAELTRQPPEVLADQITKQAERIAALERIIAATGLVRELFPDAYREALATCYFVAHGKPTALSETTSRPHPSSRPPQHNPEALRILKAEHATMHARTPWLLTATETAVRYPHGRTVRDKRVSQSPDAA